MTSLSLEEARRMSRQELYVHFANLSKWAIDDLPTALKPRNFEVLTKNSLTTAQMAEELGLSIRTISTYRTCLLQTGFAKTKLDRESNQIDEFILNAIPQLINYKKLREQTGLKENLLYRNVRRLNQQGRLLSFNLRISQRANPRYNNFKLFRDLTNEIYLYKPGEETAVADFIVQHLPLEEILNDSGMQKALTRQLKYLLPKVIFTQIYQRYHKK